jgi:glycosyltransferase involved in cell wall biosynthesis
MHFILIANYPPDKQESMERFAQMLANGFKERDYNVEIWYPSVVLGKKMQSTVNGIGKWIGYIDKWILFPQTIKKRIKVFDKQNKEVRYHICDHSNSPYLKYLPQNKTAITCHDVLAIRGGLGYKDAYCPSSPAGTIYQKWILSNLCNAKKIGCVSKFTLHQLFDLQKQYHSTTQPQNWTTVYNAFNAPFSVMDKVEAWGLVSANSSLPINSSFIFHVGSNRERKNRKMLLEMVAKAGDKWNGFICFAGQSLNEELKSLAAELKLENRIVSIVKPSHQILMALYNCCNAFVFPSFSEGFGWPVIEAQACGVPVIASNLQPMPEVSGSAALHANPHDASAFADALISLQDENLRKELIEKGFENCKRFAMKDMIDGYLQLHDIKN